MFSRFFRDHSVELACPVCGYVSDHTLRDLEMEITWLCPGCRTSIRFVDHELTARVAFRDIDAAERKLMSTLRRLGR